MTTFGFIIMLLGAGAFSAGVVRLADWIDQPVPAAAPPEDIGHGTAG